MENKDKEAILNFYDKASKSFITQETTYVNREAALKAMDKFSASQNEELKKEIKELKLFIHIDADNADDAAEQIKKHISQLQSTIDERDKEIERLKGLIEDAYVAGSSCATKILMIAAGNDNYENDKAKSWQQFKTENNL